MPEPTVPSESSFPLLMLRKEAIVDIVMNWMGANGIAVGEQVRPSWVDDIDGHTVGLRIDYSDEVGE